MKSLILSVTFVFVLNGDWIELKEKAIWGVRQFNGFGLLKCIRFKNIDLSLLDL